MDIEIDYSGESIGKYSLIKKLGKGNFGAVYKAHDRVLDDYKAIKILNVSNPKKAYELFSEASIPYKCKHNNIVKIFSGELLNFQHDIQFVIDMELVNGGSLENLLKSQFVPVVDSMLIIKNVLFGLEHSHIQGIIHRDLKPANILLHKGIPQISDFGLATALNDVIIPWKWYCTHAAPESFKNSTATVQTDIFAIGMTLYRMINNISKWKAFLRTFDNINNLLYTGKLIDKLYFEPYIPKRIEKIVKKACNANPAKRYESAAEMRNAIERLQFGYRWKPVGDLVWIGSCKDMPQKDISIVIKRKSIEVVVKNNNRKSSSDSKSFSNRSQAEEYFWKYISDSTLN